MNGSRLDGVELIRHAFELYDAGDMEALYAMAHDDIELVPVFMPGTYRGIAAVRAAMERGGAPRKRWTASNMEFRDVGGCVVVAGRLRVVASVGAPLDLPAAFVFKIADGRITRMEGHMTLAQAVASAERMP